MTDWEAEFDWVKGAFATVATALICIYVLVHIAGTLIGDVSGLPAAVMGGLVTLFIVGVYLRLRDQLKW